MTTAHAERYEFYGFNADYVSALREGVPQVKEHFAAYFSQVLRWSLRKQAISPHLIDDIRQETFLRVLRLLNEPERLRFPERLGALVVGICNNVRREFLRGTQRWTEHHDSSLDVKPGPEALAMQKQTRRAILKTFAQLSERDRDLLRALFVEQCPRHEVCLRLGVSEAYLPVLVHRAKARFRKLYEQDLSL